MTVLQLTAKQEAIVVQLLHQVLYNGLADSYVDDDAQFNAIGIVYDQLIQRLNKREKSVQLPYFLKFV